MMRCSSRRRRARPLVTAIGSTFRDAVQCVDGRWSGERARPRHRFVENAAEREHVGAMVYGPPPAPAPATCSRPSRRGCRLRLRPPLRRDFVRGEFGPQLGQAEVEHFRVCHCSRPSRFRLEVAMHDVRRCARRQGRSATWTNRSSARFMSIRRESMSARRVSPVTSSIAR